MTISVLREGVKDVNPRGATPKPVLATDDVLLDLQFEEWQYVKRHLRLEDQLNQEAWSLSKWLRWWFAKVNRLVASLRLEVQVAKRPLSKAAPQQNQSTAF